MAIKNKSYDYSEIIADFGKEKIEKRYETLYEYLDAFIKRHKYVGKVAIAESVLNQAVVDYFADVHRLKNFHHIEAINYLKIHAYTAYWILRRKPLQIIEDSLEDIDRAFVNEKFVASYLLDYLREEDTNVIIIESERLLYFDCAVCVRVIPAMRRWGCKHDGSKWRSWRVGRSNCCDYASCRRNCFNRHKKRRKGRKYCINRPFCHRSIMWIYNGGWIRRPLYLVGVVCT